MSEVSKYDAYKKKLQGVCDENNLVYRFQSDGYPITLTISPVTGLEPSLFDDEEEKDTSPDAAIVFAYKDGFLTYKVSETFTIGDALFSKIKNLYKNIHFYWLQFFFREIIENGMLSTQNIQSINDAEDLDDEPVCGAEPLDGYADDEDIDDVTEAEEGYDPLQDDIDDDYEYEGGAPDAEA